MAHSLSAQKRIRQNAKRRLRNRDRKKELRTELKKVATQIAGTNVEAATGALSGGYRLLDRSARKGTIHKNTAARRKSKLARKINAMKKARTAATA